MLHLPRRRILFISTTISAAFSPFSTATSRNIFTALKSATTTNSTTKTLISSSELFKNTHRLLSSSYLSKPISSISRPLFRSHATIPTPVLVEYPEKHEKESEGMQELRQELEEYSIERTSYNPGQKYGLTCPQGSTGNASVSSDINICTASKQPESVNTETSLQLEPLCPELVRYFAERMISMKTLQRNSVMQRRYDEQNVIAFTYGRDGMLVGCKYRSIDKRFWQMKGAKKIFYGVDDVKDADEIIIVEGEVDKLSMDEVGLCNCVSVPNGAPQKVSNKERSIEEDTGFHYLWNAKEHMDKASRIILATDGDSPGQALAEELARRVGKERCWQVRWPKKDEFNFFKDANEVLMNLGADALREAVNNAECYQM